MTQQDNFLSLIENKLLIGFCVAEEQIFWIAKIVTRAVDLNTLKSNWIKIITLELPIGFASQLYGEYMIIIIWSQTD